MGRWVSEMGGWGHRVARGVWRRGFAPEVRKKAGEEEERVGKDAAKLGDPALGWATGAGGGGSSYRQAVGHGGALGLNVVLLRWR